MWLLSVLFVFMIGNGAITSSSLNLQSTSFRSDPPSFTLVASTVGGPPIPRFWRRNGVIATSSNPAFEVTFGVTAETEQNRINAGYTSTLTVTGNLPGEYNYAFTNQASGNLRDDVIIIEGTNFLLCEAKLQSTHLLGGSPTNLTATQEDHNVMLLSWATPSSPPNGGYRVTVEPGEISDVTPASPYRVTVQQPGIYSFQVVYISQHLPGGTAELAGVTVRGK